MSATVNSLLFGIRCKGSGLDRDSSIFSGRWRRWGVWWNIGAFTWRERRDGRLLSGGCDAILVILLLFHFQGVTKIVLKPKVRGQHLHGILGIRKIKWTEWNYRSRKICNYQYTLYTWLSLTCWQAVDDIQGRCTGRFELVDSRDHSVTSLICSLRRDGDCTSQGCWRQWLHCFWFHKFGFNWENQNGRKTHFLSLTSLRGTAINKEATTQKRNVTIKGNITREVCMFNQKQEPISATFNYSVNLPHQSTWPQMKYQQLQVLNFQSVI